MDKKIIQKAGKYFTEDEKHKNTTFNFTPTHQSHPPPYKWTKAILKQHSSKQDILKM